MTAFTLSSPTSAGPVPAGVTEVGGVVIDLIGLNGVRVVSQLAASSLFEGFFNNGTPSSFEGNPGTIGTQTGFSSAALAALGGGISEIAIRITLYDGDTSSGDFDDGDNILLVNGIEVGNFSDVDTQITSDDGLDLIGETSGFPDEELATGWFHLQDAGKLAEIFQSLSSAGTVTIGLSDVDPYENLFDFTRGVDGELIDIGSPPNFSPSGVDDVIGASEDGPTFIAVSTLLANDTDPNDPPASLLLTAVSPQSGAGAAVSIGAGGTVVYAPGNVFGHLAAGETAVDSFTYTVTDPGGLSSTATVSVTITGVNDAPTAADDGLEVAARGTLSGLEATLLANDADPDTNDELRIVSVDTDGLVGTLTFSAASGTLSYAADAAALKNLAVGETFTTSFDYVMADGSGATSTATATIVVTGSTNTAPIARADEFQAAEDAPLDGDLLASNGAGADSDADGDTLTVTQVNGAALTPAGIVLASGAHVLVEADGNFRYDPSGAFDDLASGETAVDSFAYQVSDGFGGTATATATVTVQGVGGTTIDVVLPGALAPAELGTAHILYADPTGGTVRAGLILVRTEGALVADPLTGAFSNHALIFTSGGVGADPSQVDLAVNLRMASTVDTNTSFAVTVANAEAVIDWASLKSVFQPDLLSDAAWDRTFEVFTNAVGDSVSELVDELSANASIFSRFGIGGDGGAAALAFEFEQAGDFGSLAERATSGSMGRGWASLADLALEFSTSGAVVLRGLTDFSGLFSLSVDDVAAYTVSASTGRSVDVSGNLVGTSSPARPAFEISPTGNYVQVGGAAFELDRTGSGFELLNASGVLLRFDTSGRLVEAVAANGDTSVAMHDAEGRIEGFTGASGASIAFDRDGTGRVTSVSDSIGGALSFGYSAGGKLISSSGSHGTARFTADAAGDLVSASRDGGSHFDLSYDAAGRLVRIDDGDGIATQAFTYDQTGGYTITDGVGHAVAIKLLPGGIIAGVTDGTGVSTELRFDTGGTLTGAVASDGTSQKYSVDQLGRVTAIADASGAVTRYEYDGDSARLNAFIDANGERRDFNYDEQGKLSNITWADGSLFQIEYDAAGNPITAVNRRGNDIDYTYDSAGHLISASDSSSGAIDYSYDAQGRMIAAISVSGSTTIDYDGAGLVERIAWSNGRSLDYDYDAAGRRIAMTDQTGNMQTYSYDGAGRLATVGDKEGVLVTYGYDAAGNLTSETNANGTTTSYVYDTAGRIAEIINRNSSESISSFQRYGYNESGLRGSVETQDGSWIYEYDSVGQIVSANFDSIRSDISDKNFTFVYDGAGNRISSMEDGISKSYVVGQLNQYVSVGGESFTYDADGNLLTRTDVSGTTRYRYDVENRLVEVLASSGDFASYEYDVFGNRSAVTENGVRTELLVDPFGLGDIVGEFDAIGNTISQYIHGIGLASRIDAGDRDLFFDSDATGSVVGISGAGGELLNGYGYTPFGGELYERETVDNRFEFNGALGVQEDDSGILYMRARYYDDHLGRFLGDDPLVLTGDIGNPVRFSGNDPIGSADPSGLQQLFPNLGSYPTDYQGYQQFIEYQRQQNERAIAQAERLELIENVVEVGLGLTGVVGAGRALLFKAPQLFGLITLGESPAWLYYGNAVKGAITGPIKVYKGLDGIFGEDDQSEAVDPKQTPTGRSDGDPHLTTFDGLAYDFQAVGEFVLVGGPGFQIQTRQEAIGNEVAVNTATAMRIGENIVGIYSKENVPLVINGQAVDLAVGETIAVGGGSVYRSAFGSAAYKVYTVIDENGNGFWVNVYAGANHLRPFVAADNAGKVHGLLGNFDGNTTNDIALADGTVVAQPVAEQALYGAFADAWRITDATSLFVYGPGQTTATFTDRDFPSSVVTIADLDPAARAAGEAAALAAGLTPGTVDFDNAVLDVALSGNPAFAEAIGATPSPEPEPEPLAVQRPPELVSDMAATDEDVAVTIDVLANDSDPEGDALTILAASDPHGGAVLIDNDRLRFTPAADFTGLTQIVYEVRDAAGNRVSATVEVTVAALPDAPVARNDSVDVVEDAASANLFDALLANDSDADAGDTFTIVAVNASAAGATILFDAATRRLIYTADAAVFDPLDTAEQATDSFSYTIRDASGRESEAMVTVTVSGVTPDEGVDMNGTSGADILVGSNDADSLNGLDGDDRLFGGGGADVLDGAEGADRLDGGSGDDILRGGAGNDVYRIDSPSDAVVEAVGGGTDIIVTRSGFVLSDDVHVEIVRGIGSLALVLTGNVHDNRLDGSVAGDTLLGLGGSDTLSGGDGNDMIDGGVGDDVLRGDAGDDIVVGGAGNDRQLGGIGNDTLTAGDGDDVLNGEAGDDVMAGGTGNDVYHVDSAADVIVELAGEGNDVIVAAADFALSETTFVEQLVAGSDIGLTLAGNAGDNLIRGGAGADTLIGGGGNDVFYGGDGDDVIAGGAGMDLLRGNAGADRFVFNAASESMAADRDRILDFRRAEGDRIDLSAIDSVAGGNDDSFAFVSDFSHQAGQLRVVKIGMIYLVQGDIDGDGLADMDIRVASDTVLGNVDFIL